MAGDSRRTAPVDARAQQKGRVTVMIIRDVGRVLSFKVSPRLVLPAAAFLLLYLLASVLLINGYFSLRHLAGKQTATLAQYQAREDREAKRLPQAEERIAFLEAYIEDLESGKRREGPSAGPRKTETVAPARPPRDEGPGTEAPALAAPGPEEAREAVLSDGEDDGEFAEAEQQEAGSAESVALKEAGVRREGSDVIVRFSLVNLHAGVKPATGYLHIIALGTQEGSPKAWSDPEEPLADGLPKDYRNGRRYNIRRFKPIHGRFRLDPASASLTSVKILLYDPSGGLLVMEELEVGDAP